MRNPELTGMPEPALDQLVDQLTAKLDVLREQGGSSNEEVSAFVLAAQGPRTS
ncbi:hypothetical protein [Streptomyces chartreusis]